MHQPLHRPSLRHCEGCGRTLLELNYWSRMTEPQRHAVIALIPARAKKFNVTLGKPL